MKQIFDEFLNEYLNKQDKTVCTEYEKAKEELLENNPSPAKKQTQKHTLSQQRQRKDVKTRGAIRTPS